MQNSIDLSIIIPVYGVEKYIRKCLDSVFKNLPDNTEVIIINDGTKDNSETIILEFVQKYKDIIAYYKKENGGLSHTKNYGLSKAHGKYITFVDSDDYVDENMHKDMLNLAIKEDADVVYCDVELVYESDGHKIISNCTNDSRPNDFFKAIDTSLMAASWNKMAKRELFDGIDYPVGLNNEDVAVTPILLGRANKILKINKPYYKYVQRAGSIQNSTFSNKRFSTFKTSKLCIERAKELSEEYQEELKGTLYIQQMLVLLLYPINDIHDETRMPLIKEICELLNDIGNDLFTNKYVLEHMHNIKLEKLLDQIKNNEYENISKTISTYNKKIKFKDKLYTMKKNILKLMKKQ